MTFHGRIESADGGVPKNGWDAYRLVFTSSAAVDGVPRSRDRSITSLEGFCLETSTAVRTRTVGIS